MTARSENVFHNIDLLVGESILPELIGDQPDLPVSLGATTPMWRQCNEDNTATLWFPAENIEMIS